MAMEEKTDIQKLKDLFVEYHGEGVYGIIEPEHGIYLREAMQARAPYIISKKYGFIKWLVENEKIKDYYEGNDDVDYVREKYGFYEALLMLLSIQDNPIDFLSSILK